MAKAKTTKIETQTQAAADEPTPEERLHTLRSILRHKIDTSRAVVDAFAKELASPDRRPLETLSWSIRVFEAAATLAVAQEILDRFDTGESIVDVHAHVQREALRGAKSGSSSTSAASNLASTCRTAALAELEDYLRYDAIKTKTETKAAPKMES